MLGGRNDKRGPVIRSREKAMRRLQPVATPGSSNFSHPIPAWLGSHSPLQEVVFFFMAEKDNLLIGKAGAGRGTGRGFLNILHCRNTRKSVLWSVGLKCVSNSDAGRCSSRYIHSLTQNKSRLLIGQAKREGDGSLDEVEQERRSLVWFGLVWMDGWISPIWHTVCTLLSAQPNPTQPQPTSGQIV